MRRARGEPTAARADSCSRRGGHVLKALALGLCALVLCATPVAAHAGTTANPGVELARHVKSMRKHATVIRFFQSHRWLLRDPRFAREAAHRLGRARRGLEQTQAKAARLRMELARRQRESARRRFLASVERSPEKAICHVFGTYCEQALQVARCESGYRTTAQNGQYHGIFQMGSHERQTYGHGATALAQAKAAYRYFVLSGRDWSPWSCKP